MIVDVAYSMSGKDLAVVRTAKTGIANLDDVLEVFRELTEKGIQSCAELVSRHSMPLKLEQEWSRMWFKLRFTVWRHNQFVE
jgi:hypothetical protein